jgi:ATP-dependent exoDNAse (exonuclease V) alpha subunit
LVGSKTMARVFDLAERADARIVLSGDRRQHKSVERGSPLRLLEEEAGIIPAEVREIQRQKGLYKEAVKALSEGRAEEGFDRLDGLGWVREIGEWERHGQLAADYAEAVGAGETALIVSPTHLEKDRITREIRRVLLAEGKLDGEGREIPVLISRQLTGAEKADPAQYQPGDILQFHQNAKGYRKGERIEATGAVALPLGQANRFEVFHRGKLAIAAGDVVRITRNGTTADGKHSLHNGDLHRVRGFGGDGAIVLENGWAVGRDFGHLDYGYVVTSHAAQGKTVDRVFIGQSADSFAATSREQFYVSCSRGRKSATVYTNDKQALRVQLARSEQQLAARDVAAVGSRLPVPKTRQRLKEAERRRLVQTPTAARASAQERQHER